MKHSTIWYYILQKWSTILWYFTFAKYSTILRETLYYISKILVWDSQNFFCFLWCDTVQWNVIFFTKSTNVRLSNSLNPRGLPQCLHESYQTPFCYATIDIRTNINEATFCYRISSRKRSAYAVSWLTNNIQSHSYAPLREGQQTFSQTQHLFQENIKKVLSFVEGKKNAAILLVPRRRIRRSRLC